jgi:4-hydroxy-3-methylbut-2-enyl diphosphate reductase
VNVDRVVLASPRSLFCGLGEAKKSRAWLWRKLETPVYCYHEIVHNRFVVEYFESIGVIFVDDVALVPPHAPVMLSAHGSPPELVEAARRNRRTVIDAVCPLVTKVHHELKVRANKGYTVLYVGHEGHEEAVGTMAVAPESVHLIETRDDIDALVGLDGPFALLSQTTLSLDEWQDLREYAEEVFPDIWMPNRSDLCFATTNRQAALREVAEGADAVIVIGSANSSNTMALTKAAAAQGCSRVLRVNGASELPDDLSGTIAVTAGASAPESLVNEVLALLDPTDGVTVKSVIIEDEYFPPPPELREILKAISALVELVLQTPERSTFDGQQDRDFTATEVLATSAF